MDHIAPALKAAREAKFNIIYTAHSSRPRQSMTRWALRVGVGGVVVDGVGREICGFQETTHCSCDSRASTSVSNAIS